MRIINKIKNNIRNEIRNIKEQRKLNRDPDVLKYRLEQERMRLRAEKDILLKKIQLEKDKRELQQLKNSTGIKGSIRNALSNVKKHLDDVKKRNNDSVKNKVVNGSRNRTSVFDIKGKSSIMEPPIGMKGVIGYKSFNDEITGLVGKKKIKKKK